MCLQWWCGIGFAQTRTPWRSTGPFCKEVKAAIAFDTAESWGRTSSCDTARLSCRRRSGFGVHSRANGSMAGVRGLRSGVMTGPHRAGTASILRPGGDCGRAVMHFSETPECRAAGEAWNPPGRAGAGRIPVIRSRRWYHGGRRHVLRLWDPRYRETAGRLPPFRSSCSMGA